jgi:hypothetical protein
MKRKNKILNPKNVDRLASSEMEVDTDVNEDLNREQLLDQSLEDFLDEVKY